MKKFPFWLIAVLITVAAAFYQRMTGPTYPVRGKLHLAGSDVGFRLPRTAETTGPCSISLEFPAPAEGFLEYKRYKTDDPWIRETLVRKDAGLIGFLPQQPATGKLIYQVFIVAEGKTTALGGADSVIIRFKDPVPLWLIIIHALVMFAGMLVSIAAGLAALGKKRNPRPYALLALAFLFVGGFILGPLVQKFAFGVFWSGFPKGMDLTDNKTLISVLFWLAAVIAGRKGKPARAAVLIASIVTFVVFIIPHSLAGSELKYTKPE
jgi:hypothetical protein